MPCYSRPICVTFRKFPDFAWRTGYRDFGFATPFDEDLMTSAIAEKPRAVRAPEVNDQSLFIGGEWAESLSGKSFPVINPATGATICCVAEAGPADVDRAVKAA